MLHFTKTRRKQIPLIDALLLEEVKRTPIFSGYAKIVSNAEKIRFCDRQISKIAEAKNSQYKLVCQLISIEDKEVEWRQEREEQLDGYSSLTVLRRLVVQNIFSQSVFDYERNLYNDKREKIDIYPLVSNCASITKVLYGAFMVSAVMTLFLALSFIPSFCGKVPCDQSNFYKLLKLSISLAAVTYFVNFFLVYYLRKHSNLILSEFRNFEEV